MTYKTFLQKSKSQGGGFNLVEVVLAMCVIAVAFTSLFGVMPVALQNYRHAMSFTVQSNILVQVTGEFQQTSPDQIEAMVNNNTVTPSLLYFDNEGQQVSQSTQASYTVTLAFPSSSGGGNASVDTSIFGTGGNGVNGNPNTALVPILLTFYGIHGGVQDKNPLNTKIIFISSPDDPKAPTS